MKPSADTSVPVTLEGNYNDPAIGVAAPAILAKSGVGAEIVYPRCCGMPQLEQGDIAAVAESAKQTAQDLKPWIDKGYDVIALVPSCALMLKFEWPLIVPKDDAGYDSVVRLSKATRDISEYIVGIADKEGLALLDLKDLRALLKELGERGKEITTEH